MTEIMQNRKTTVTPAPPNLWVVQKDEGPRGLWAYPIIAFEHFHDYNDSDGAGSIEPYEVLGTDFIYLSTDGGTSSRPNSDYKVVHAESFEAAIRFAKRLMDFP